MDALPSICTLSYGNTVVNVQHLPFHVGSSPNMDLQIGEDFFPHTSFPSQQISQEGSMHVSLIPLACTLTAFITPTTLPAFSCRRVPP